MPRLNANSAEHRGQVRPARCTPPGCVQFGKESNEHAESLPSTANDGKPGCIAASGTPGSVVDFPRARSQIIRPPGSKCLSRAVDRAFRDRARRIISTLPAGSSTTEPGVPDAANIPACHRSQYLADFPRAHWTLSRTGTHRRGATSGRHLAAVLAEFASNRGMACLLLSFE